MKNTPDAPGFELVSKGEKGINCESWLDRMFFGVLIILMVDVAVILTLLLVWGSYAIIHEMLK